ncbi:barstar family protein [Anaerococcus sp.]|uniref:barstar family protein n=1 Tax=Anaerococcus sp. TaxID=1872515 RepID=UPI00290305F3|nr:barstar family protein [Anaerococcus sp.]MDU1828345.1 barstar family protein [Anaerococcus sp.]
MIEIDANDFKDKETVYKILNEKCDFIYYVQNLDALYDQLVTKDNEIKIINFRQIFLNLGDYGNILVRVFIDAVKDYDSQISLVY